MLGLGSDVLTGETSCKKSYVRMRDLCGATNRAASAGYAVEGFLCALLELASLCVCDVLHNVEALGTSLGAGVAADAGVDLGIKLHHDLLVGFDLVDLISSLIDRKSVV